MKPGTQRQPTPPPIHPGCEGMMTPTTEKLNITHCSCFHVVRYKSAFDSPAARKKN